MEYHPINLEVAFQFIYTKCNKKNFVSGHVCDGGLVEMLVPPETVICNKCRTIYRTDLSGG